MPQTLVSISSGDFVWNYSKRIHSVQIREYQSGNVIQTIQIPENYESVEYMASVRTQKEQYVMMGCNDGRILMMEAMSFEYIEWEHAHRNRISVISVGNCDQVAVGSLDGDLSFHRIDSGFPTVLKHVNMAHEQRITSIEYFDDLVITGGLDGKLKFWLASEGVLLETISLASAINDFLVVDQQYIWIACEDSKIYIYNAHSYSQEKILPMHMKSVQCLTKLQNEIWSASNDGVICVWDVEKMKFKKRMPNQSVSNIEKIVPIARASTYRLWTFADGAIKMWDAQCGFQFSLSSENMYQEQVTPNSKQETEYLKTINKSLMNQIEILKGEKAEMKSMNLSQSLKCEQLKQHNLSLREELFEQSERLQESMNESQILKEKSVDQDEICTMQSKLNETELSLNSEQKENERLRSIISQLEIDLGDVTSELANAKRKEIDDAQRINSLSSKIRDFEKDIKQKTHQQNYLESKLTQNDTLMTEISQLIHKVLRGKSSDNVDYLYIQKNKKVFIDKVLNVHEIENMYLISRQQFDTFIQELNLKRSSLKKEPTTTISDGIDLLLTGKDILADILEHFQREKESQNSHIQNLRSEIENLKYQNVEKLDVIASLEAHSHDYDMICSAIEEVLLEYNEDFPSFKIPERHLERAQEVRRIFKHMRKSLANHVTQKTSIENTIADVTDIVLKFQPMVLGENYDPTIFKKDDSELVRDIREEVKRLRKKFETKKEISRSLNHSEPTFEITISDDQQLLTPIKSSEFPLTPRSVPTPSPRKANLQRSRPTIIRHINPSPSTPHSPIMKSNVNKSPPKKTVEQRSDFLRLKISEFCLLVVHLYQTRTHIRRYHKFATSDLVEIEKELNQALSELHSTQITIRKAIKLLEGFVSLISFQTNSDFEPFKPSSNDIEVCLHEYIKYLQDVMQTVIVDFIEQRDLLKEKLQKIKIMHIMTPEKKSLKKGRKKMKG